MRDTEVVMVTKNWKVSYRYKQTSDSKWIYDYLSTQAQSYSQAKERVLARVRKELNAWEIEL